LGTEITNATRKMQKFAFNWKQFPSSANIWCENIRKSAASKIYRRSGSYYPLVALGYLRSNLEPSAEHRVSEKSRAAGSV
jgi:hypothetical protein